MPTPALIGIDWGTSSLRGALLAADGTVLASHQAPRGLLSVPAGGWAAVFEAEFGAWCQAHPQLPVLMAGMVGSRQGWAEAPYCPCPSRLQDLAARLHWLQPGRLAIVPGVCQDGADDAAPDVMRGEETQVFGALALQQRRDATLLLPGTHSKWVTVVDGRITGLATHMTGEAYALLRQHSILSRTLPADEAPLDTAAFEAGVLQARQPGGLLHHLFAVRTLALFERASPAQNASRLSGLLIGEELRARHAQAGLPTDTPVLLVGGAALARRYAQALALWRIPSQVVDEQASWHGLAALAGTLRG